MKNIFLAVAFLATFSFAMAQPKTDAVWAMPCDAPIVAWGSDKVALMEEAFSKSMTFKEVDQSEEQAAMFHVTFAKGDRTFMFSFAHNQLVAYAINMAYATKEVRNQMVNKHLATFLAVADSIVSSKSFIIECGEDSIRASVLDNSSGIGVQFINHTAMRRAILSQMKREE